jgi:transcriptional regulator with XRE-family HTH domain
LVDTDKEGGGLKLTRLRDVRELHGWSQSKLAEESGVSRDGISNYETGHREAWPSTAKKLADALGVEIGDLVTRVEEPVLAGKSEARSAGPSQESLFNGHPLKAGYWIETLEANTALYEDILESGSYSLDRIRKAEYATVELASLYGKYIKEMRGLASDTQWQALEEAKERIRGLRRTLREASRRKFEEERDKLDPGKVYSIEQKRAELDRRVAQEERDAS